MASVTGGDKLQARLAEIAAKVDKHATLRVGFLEGSTEVGGASLPMVAAIHEFGAPGAGIPPRSFMRPTVKQHSAEWGAIVAAQLPASDYDVTLVFGRLGETVKGEIQEAIQAISSPALSPITLMLRKMFGNNPQDITGRDVGIAARRVASGEQGAGGTQAHPLIWTGTMLKGVSHEVTT